MPLLKDKKITLYRAEYIKDSAGFSTARYIPFTGRIWAYVRQLSAQEYFAAKAVQQREEMLFVINWRDDISPDDCFVEYRGVMYNVTRVDTFEGYREDLRVYAAKLATQPGPEVAMQG